MKLEIDVSDRLFRIVTDSIKTMNLMTKLVSEMSNKINATLVTLKKTLDKVDMKKEAKI